MEETKRLREELALIKLKLEIDEIRARRSNQPTESIATNDIYNVIINNSSNFTIKA